jgi:hypothetical protein
MFLARLREGITPTEAARRIAREVVTPVSYTFAGAAIPLTRLFGAPDSPIRIIREGGHARIVGFLAALVLVAGCTTLAALLLVGYERRRRELAVRLALGAPRGQLVRQLAGELVAPVIAGVLGAVAVGPLGVRLIPALKLPGGVDLARLDLSLDWRVLLAVVTICILAMTLAALLPVVRFTRTALAGDLVSATTATSITAIAPLVAGAACRGDGHRARRHWAVRAGGHRRVRGARRL